MDAALPVSSGTPGASGVPERTRAAPFVRMFALAAIVSAVLVVALLAFVRREQHLALGGEIVHDDFGFRVREVSAQPVVSSSSSDRAREVHVRFDVANHARRVPFDLSTWAPVLTDERGAAFEADTAAETELARTLGRTQLREGSLAAGASAECTAIFRVPVDARGLRFSISWGGPLVDLVDRFLFGAKEIALGEIAETSAR